MASKFAQITNYQIREEVIGKGTKLGVEVGLEIPLSCFFFLWRSKNYNTGEKKLGRKVFCLIQETENRIAMAHFRDLCSNFVFQLVNLHSYKFSCN